VHLIVKRLYPQPLIGAGTLALAVLAVVAFWMRGSFTSTATSNPAQALTSLFLVVAVVLAYRFPIHIRRDVKIYMASIPLYLIASLLSPPLAAVTAGLGVLTSQLNIRSQRGGYLSDVATETGRWIIVVLLGSIVAHLPMTDAVLAYIVAAGVLWTGDMLTCPLVLSPISGEAPWRIVDAMVQEVGVAEAAQYLVGLLGVLAAMQRTWALILLALPTVLVYLAFKRAKELHEDTRRLLESMADTVDLRDPYTGGHSRRVAMLTEAILDELRTDGPERDLVVSAARVHDIGKIGVPDYILYKKASFTPDEQRIMEMHVEYGADLLLRYPEFARGVDIVRHHHERWDGRGYPHRLKERQIPFGARVIAVADSFDAMTSDRPYRRALSADQAVSILREGRGAQWDPIIVDAFVRSIDGQLKQPAAPVLRVVSDPPPEDGPAVFA